MTVIESIHAALATVEDPEIHRPLPDLGMIESVQAESGVARLKILLTISGCPMQDRLRTDITKAVMAVETITSVEISFGVMNEEQRGTLRVTIILAFASAASSTTWLFVRIKPELSMINPEPELPASVVIETTDGSTRLANPATESGLRSTEFEAVTKLAFPPKNPPDAFTPSAVVILAIIAGIVGGAWKILRVPPWCISVHFGFTGTKLHSAYLATT